jgi:hypothetical protein
MANKKTQIGFRVTEAVRRQVEAECLKRDLSVQDLFTASFEYYRKTPAEWDYGATAFVREGPDVTDEEIAERLTWTTLWLKYIQSVPREEILIFADAIKYRLKDYKSSRRKKVSGRPSKQAGARAAKSNRQRKEKPE